VATENIEFVLTAKDATSAAFDRVKASLGEIETNVAAVGAQAAVLVGVVGAVALKFGEMADKLDTSRTLLGIHAQTLRDWQHTALLSNIQGDELVSMLQRLQRTADEATSGANKELASSFEAIGISQTDLQGKLSNLEQLYPAVLEGIRNLNNGYGEAKIAQDLFSRSGQALLPLIRQSKEETDDLTDAFHRQAGVVTDEEIKALADANDQWEGFLDTLKNRALTTFATVRHEIDLFNLAVKSTKLDQLRTEFDDLTARLESGASATALQKAQHFFMQLIAPGIDDGFAADREAVQARLKVVAAEYAKAKDEFADQLNLVAGGGKPNEPAAPETPFTDPAVKAKEDQVRRMNELEDLRTQYQQQQAQVRADAESAANSYAISQIDSFDERFSEQLQREVDLQKKADKAKLLSASQSALQHLAIATSGSKALFAVSKAAALADAIINTYKAVQVARASAPPPYNYVLAAIELAAGLANVASIASASFGSGSGVSGQASGPGGLAPAIPPALPPNTEVNPADQQASTVTVVVKGGDSAGRALLDMLAIEVNQNDGVFIKSGSRQAAELA